MSRITIDQTLKEALLSLSDNNPGAITVLMGVIKQGMDIDLSKPVVEVLLDLDDLGIYGTDIWVLYSDICQRNIARFLAVLRAWNKDYISGETLKDACSRQDYSGVSMVPVLELYNKITKDLPEFDPEAIGISDLQNFESF